MSIKTDCEVIFFVSSSGHCTLDCPYCIIEPIAKHEPSLNYGDIEFLLDTFQKKAFLAFSGKGDFFAGYKKSDKLLASILDQEVGVALDINGVMIHEFPELSDRHLQKIRAINLTMHYQQIREKNLQKIWTQNAQTLIKKKGEDLFLDTIISPLLVRYWDEALRFYERQIFNETGKKIVLVRDIHRPLNEAQEDYLLTLSERFRHLVGGVHQEDFAKIFEKHTHVFCPAGSSYFRIWNNGEISGCPNIQELSQSGNVKGRRIAMRDKLFRCAEMRYCDCHAIEGLGKMIFETPAPVDSEKT